jgi:chromosome segregation ATPase
MDMYMSPQMPSPLEPSRLRRRIIVELTPDEVPLLDAAERRHGTKRAAILAGLRAEAGAIASEGPENEAAETAARAATEREAAHAKDTKARVRTQKALEKQLAELTRERDAAKSEIARLEDRAVAAHHEAQVQYGVLFEDIAALEAEIPEALFCGRCERWAPEGEWVWRADGEHELAYHTPCGDHGPGAFSDASWLARRRRLEEKSTP